MQQGFRTDTQQKLQLRVDPRLVLNGQLLEMNTVELRTTIEAELVENPALEWLDQDGEPMYLETILKSVAPQELAPSSDDREFHRSLPNDSESFEWLDFAGSGNSLESHLEAQLGAVLEERFKPIWQTLVGSLDDRGYLDSEVEQIALDHNFDLEAVEYVLSTLQECEPSGIGSRNLRECLLLQLKGSTTLEGKLAYGIVKHCFDDLVDRNIRGIARRFKVLPDLVQTSLDVIRQCNPYPADGFHREASLLAANQGSSAVAVDLKIVRDESGWTVEVPGVDPRDLIISQAYREHMLRLQNCVQSEQGEKKHIASYVSRAKNFIDALDQRLRTLSRLGLYLVEHQLGFVTTGEYRFLKAMTRRQIAAALGLHESTISRATAGKHLQLANGEVVPFEVFFKPALRVQQMISEILATEDPDHPLSDERIAQMLADRGVTVARRTVNKYRDRGKLLSSRRRRSA